jgi:hypothetical protein
MHRPIVLALQVSEEWKREYRIREEMGQKPQVVPRQIAVRIHALKEVWIEREE